jgi:hypothetical protein
MTPTIIQDGSESWLWVREYLWLKRGTWLAPPNACSSYLLQAFTLPSNKSDSLHTWQKDEHYLEYEVFLGRGVCEFFYRNKKTGEVYGRDIGMRGELALPGTLLDKLALFAEKDLLLELQKQVYGLLPPERCSRDYRWLYNKDVLICSREPGGIVRFRSLRSHGDLEARGETTTLDELPELTLPLREILNRFRDLDLQRTLYTIQGMGSLETPEEERRREGDEESICYRWRRGDSELLCCIQSGEGRLYCSNPPWVHYFSIYDIPCGPMFEEMRERVREFGKLEKVDE